MDVIETYLTAEFFEASFQSGEVHSVFEHSFNIVFGESMITVHCDARAGIPDSIVLTKKDFDVLSGVDVGESVLLKLGELHFQNANLVLRSATNRDNKFKAPLNFCTQAELEHRLSSLEFKHTLSHKAENFFEKLISSLDEKNISACIELLSNLIGLGSGLTPSADDALLGIMAVAECCGIGGEKTSSEFAAEIYRLSAGRTSDVSRKYLRCASQGRFSIPLISVVSSLCEAGGELDSSALSQLLGTGHSSGKDIFYGVVLALSAKHFDEIGKN